MLIITALGNLRQGHCGFEVSLAYIEKLYLNKIKQKKREREEGGKGAGRRREKKMEVEERQTGREGEKEMRGKR